MKTKIVATIGPASNSKATLKNLIEAGVRIFRLNFSHGDASLFVDVIRFIRELEAEMRIPVTIMQDLSGPKIRLGKLSTASIEVAKSDVLLLGPSSAATSELPYLPFDHPEILESLIPDDRLVLADGGLQFTVVERRNDGLVLLKAANAGIVTSRKGLALPGKATKIAALTAKDKKDLADGLILGVDAVAISYVQTPEDVRETKNIIMAAGKNIPVVVKLERQSAVDRLAEILRETDVVMVARGDLGIECPMPELPALQKRIIRACNALSKPVIVATQMLLSMVNNPVPTRAETTDVANAVLDGADCVMLSEETAMGNYPVETVRFMRQITERAETLLLEQHILQEPPEDKGIEAYLAYSACLLAKKTNAKGIVSHSMSGASARLISSRRPPQPIYGMTPEAEVVKHLNFSWGVLPVHVANLESSHVDRVEHFIDQAPQFNPDDTIIITAGQPKPGDQRRGTNLVKLYRK
ncbi:MAG: pyruvate kinase [Deltaproteobacteria bacterium]|nr:pyruvate kinase [Deltaproteobacteria bacterium]